MAAKLGKGITVHNLGAVVQFEIRRTLKKKTFWISALALPVVAALIAVVIAFSNSATSEVGKQLTNERYSLGITDNSRLILPAFLASLEAQKLPTKEAGKAAVQKGQLDAYFYYPADISKEPVEVYGQEVGLFKNGRYQGLAEHLLTESVLAAANNNVRAILQDKITYQAATYKDGQEDKGMLKIIAPGIFLLLFYFMVVTFGGQMLTSIIEEKENRVIEMILTTIKPTTLLLGKLFSLMILAFVQMLVILLPIAGGYFLFRHQLSLPNFDLASIPFDPLAISLGSIIFVVSFLMYTGILMTIGATMPTAKEANSFFGLVLTFAFAPLYAATLFVSSPGSLIVQVLSYFPLTSPIPLLLRNAVGNLSIQEAGVAIALLLLTTVIAIRIGVRVFKYGALEYSRKLTAKEILRKQ